GMRAITSAGSAGFRSSTVRSVVAGTQLPPMKFSSVSVATAIERSPLRPRVTDVAVQDHASVDDELVPGHVARGIGGEEDDRLGDLLGARDPAERNPVLVVPADVR